MNETTYGKFCLAAASYLWHCARLGSLSGFPPKPRCSSAGWLCLTLKGDWWLAGHSVSAQWYDSLHRRPVNTENHFNSFTQKTPDWVHAYIKISELKVACFEVGRGRKHFYNDNFNIFQTSLHELQLHRCQSNVGLFFLSWSAQHICSYNAVMCGEVLQRSTTGFLCFFLLAGGKQRQVILQSSGVDQPTCPTRLWILNDWEVKGSLDKKEGSVAVTALLQDYFYT